MPSTAPIIVKAVAMTRQAIPRVQQHEQKECMRTQNRIRATGAGPITTVRPTSVDHFARLLAPNESIFWTMEAHQPDATVCRPTARTPRDDHIVTRLQRLPGDSLTVELSSTTPLHRVAHQRTVLFLDHEVHKGMGIAEHELHQLPFDGHRLVFQICGSKRVMRGRL